MESFNQTNPIDNYHNLVKNLEETGAKIEKLKIKIGKIVIQLIQNPTLNKLLMNNIALIKKCFNLQIQLNISLKNYFGFIPLSSKYYDFVIHLNQNMLLKIITMETIFKSANAEKIQKYIDSFTNLEMGSMYGSFGTKLLGVTADGLNKLSDIIRNFNPKSFIKDAKSGLESLQTNLQKQVGDLTQKVAENTPQPIPMETTETMEAHQPIPMETMETTETPQPIPMETMETTETHQPIPMETMETTETHQSIPMENMEMPQPILMETDQFNTSLPQMGGRLPFNKIYHPEIKKWVNLKSLEGVDALLKYTSYLE